MIVGKNSTILFKNKKQIVPIIATAEYESLKYSPFSDIAITSSNKINNELIIESGIPNTIKEEYEINNQCFFIKYPSIFEENIIIVNVDKANNIIEITSSSESDLNDIITKNEIPLYLQYMEIDPNVQYLSRIIDIKKGTLTNSYFLYMEMISPFMESLIVNQELDYIGQISCCEVVQQLPYDGLSFHFEYTYLMNRNNYSNIFITQILNTYDIATSKLICNNAGNSISKSITISENMSCFDNIIFKDANNKTDNNIYITNGENTIKAYDSITLKKSSVTSYKLMPMIYKNKDYILHKDSFHFQCFADRNNTNFAGKILSTETTPSLSNFLKNKTISESVVFKVNGEVATYEQVDIINGVIAISLQSNQIKRNTNIIEVFGNESFVINDIVAQMQHYDCLVRRPKTLSDFLSMESLKNIRSISESSKDLVRIISDKYNKEIQTNEIIDNEKTITIVEDETFYNENAIL